MESVLGRLLAAQYTGGDTAAGVLAACDELTQLTGNAWSMVSDDGATLVLRETAADGRHADWPIMAGQVVVVDPSVGIVDRLAAQVFLSRYVRLTDLLTAVGTGLAGDPAFIAAVAAAVGTPARAAENVRPSD